MRRGYRRCTECGEQSHGQRKNCEKCGAELPKGRNPGPLPPSKFIERCKAEVLAIKEHLRFRPEPENTLKYRTHLMLRDLKDLSQYLKEMRDDDENLP